MQITYVAQRPRLNVSVYFLRFRSLVCIFTILVYGLVLVSKISPVLCQAPSPKKNVAFNVTTHYFTSRCYEKKLSVRSLFYVKCGLRFHFRPFNKTWESVKIFRRVEPEVPGYVSFEGDIQTFQGTISFALNAYSNGQKCQLSFTQIKDGLDVYPYNSKEFDCRTKEFEATYRPPAYPVLPSFAYGYPRRPPQELIDAGSAHFKSFSKPRYINITYQLIFEKDKMHFSHFSNEFHFKFQTYFMQHPIVPGMHVRLVKRPDVVQAFFQSCNYQILIHKEKGFIDTSLPFLSNLTQQFLKSNGSKDVNLGIHLTPLLLNEYGTKLGSALVNGMYSPQGKAITLITTGRRDTEHVTGRISAPHYLLELLDTIVHETLHLVGARHSDQAANPNFFHIMSAVTSHNMEYSPLPMSWDTQLDILEARTNYWKNSPIFSSYV